MLAEGLVLEEIANQIKDRTVKNLKVHFEGLITDGLSEVGFADPWWADKEDVGGLTNEGTGSQFKDGFTLDGVVEVPIEVFESFQVTEIRHLGASAQEAFLANGHFILEDKFQEFGMGESAGGGLLKSDGESLQEA